MTLIGAGSMGGAMLKGWVAQGQSRVIDVVEPFPQAWLTDLAATGQIVLNPVPRAADIVVLAVKPQELPAIGAALGERLAPGGMILSILAGTPIVRLRALAPARAVARAMPNLPAQIGAGISALFVDSDDDADWDLAAGLLSPLGAVERLADEALIDVATAISGSGPGYFFAIAAALAEAGAALGLAPEAAMRLARATLVGAGALAGARGETLAALEAQVASRGGTTAAALAAMRDGDALPILMQRAASAALARAKALAQAKP